MGSEHATITIAHIKTSLLQWLNRMNPTIRYVGFGTSILYWIVYGLHCNAILYPKHLSLRQRPIEYSDGWFKHFGSLNSVH